VVAALLGLAGCQPRAETINTERPAPTELPAATPIGAAAGTSTPVTAAAAVSPTSSPRSALAPPTTTVAVPSTAPRPAPTVAAATPVTRATGQSTVPLSCPNGSYTNVNRSRVCSPYTSPNGPPAGATAACNDGTYSMSQHRQGTCSGHGGVARFL